MENTNLKFYATANFGSWYIVTCFLFPTEMIFQNDFELQKRGPVFALVFKLQVLPNTLNTNKNPMVFSCKSFLEFPYRQADTAILKIHNLVAHNSVILISTLHQYLFHILMESFYEKRPLLQIELVL